MGWSEKRKKYCGCGLSLLMVTVGVALIPIVDYIVKEEVKKVRQQPFIMQEKSIYTYR